MPTQSELTLSLHGETFKTVDSSGHSIFVPANLNGLRLLKEILRAKALNPSGKLGTNANPTQAMVEAFLKNVQLEKENALIEDQHELARMF